MFSSHFMMLLKIITGIRWLTSTGTQQIRGLLLVCLKMEKRLVVEVHCR